MLIGIVSDTHGDVQSARRAVRIFDTFEVGLIIHCGDIGHNVVGEFTDRPIHFVRGNTDDLSVICSAVNARNQTFHDRFGTMEVEGISIAFLHGDDVALLRETIQSQRWDVVCVGHTHSASKSNHGRTLVINPGALYRSFFPSVAVLEVPSREVTFIPMS
jgi:uncharacterized protein